MVTFPIALWGVEVKSVGAGAIREWLVHGTGGTIR